MSAGVCRDCHATIKFVRLDTGRLIPVEPIPNTRGNVAAAKRPGGRLIGYVISEKRPLEPGFASYVPHFADCKQARRPKTPTPRPPSLFDQPV